MIKEATTHYAPDKAQGHHLISPHEHLNILVLVLNVRDTPEMSIVLSKRLWVMSCMSQPV
jgi:hypothetical protein